MTDQYELRRRRALFRVLGKSSVLLYKTIHQLWTAPSYFACHTSKMLIGPGYTFLRKEQYNFHE